MMPDTLRISEIFHSIQGESTYAGQPCSFIRLAGCNLSCSWCDTRYALDDADARKLPLAMILAAIAPHRSRLVEITGGEPLLQTATPELSRRLLDAGHTVLVETNGSMDISVLPYPVVRIMDLKAPSSGMSVYNRMENLVHLRRGDEVKFVLADRLDYEWAKTIIGDEGYPLREVTTLFSAVGGRVTLAELSDWILADHLPVRLNVQLHKFIWPDIERGV